MNKLNVIREACIKANPSIMDLVLGCEFNIPGSEKNPWVFPLTSVPKDAEILGRPIRLADVLLVLVKRNYDKPDTPITGWMRDQEHIVLKWNLRNDLSHQSPETLEFISSLL